MRLVQKGEKYGLDDCLTHDAVDPLIEFYSRQVRNPLDPLGIFVSRYHLSLFLQVKSGIKLNSEPEWFIDSDKVKQVQTWAKHESLHFRQMSA